jgi:hypothetical protein
MIAGEHFCSRGFLSANGVKTVGPATAGLVLRSRLVFTGDSVGSNPRLWSGHPEAI